MDDHRLKRELDDLVQSDPRIFEFLQSGSLDGIWYWDLDTPEHEWMSPRFWETFGYDPSEKKHLASEWQDMIHPDDLPRCVENFQRHCADPRHPYDQIVRYRHKDGSTVWVRCRGLAIRDDGGKPVRMLGAHTDVTALKRADEALAERTRELSRVNQKLAVSEERFELAVRGSTDGLWDWNCLTDEVYYAPRFRELLGYRTTEEFPGVLESFRSHLHPNDLEPTFAAVDAHLERHEPYDVEYRLRTKDGVWRWFRARGQAVWDENGAPSRMSGSIQDITDLVEAKRRIREANESTLAAKNRELEQFVHTASHDLKSPLVTMLGYAEYLIQDIETGKTDEIKDYAQRIQANAGRMRDIIDDLLEFSRVGRVSHDPQPIRLENALDEVVDLVRAEIEERGAEIHRDFAVEHVHADPTRLRQVLQNLLTNAIRYGCGSGDPRIDVGSVARNGEVRLYVRDHGAGIAPEHHDRIFAIFQRLTSDKASTGVGLSIVRRIAETHAGRAWVESEPGAGATFWVSFPDASHETTGDHHNANEHAPESGPIPVG